MNGPDWACTIRNRPEPVETLRAVQKRRLQRGALCPVCRETADTSRHVLTHEHPAQTSGDDSPVPRGGAKHRSDGGSGDRNQDLPKPSQATPDLAGPEGDDNNNSNNNTTTSLISVQWFCMSRALVALHVTEQERRADLVTQLRVRALLSRRKLQQLPAALVPLAAQLLRFLLPQLIPSHTIRYSCRV